MSSSWLGGRFSAGRINKTHRHIEKDLTEGTWVEPTLNWNQHSALQRTFWCCSKAKNCYKYLCWPHVVQTTYSEQFEISAFWLIFHDSGIYTVCKHLYVCKSSHRIPVIETIGVCFTRDIHFSSDAASEIFITVFILYPAEHVPKKPARRPYTSPPHLVSFCCTNKYWETV